MRFPRIHQNIANRLTSQDRWAKLLNGSCTWMSNKAPPSEIHSCDVKNLILEGPILLKCLATSPNSKPGSLRAVLKTLTRIPSMLHRVYILYLYCYSYIALILFHHDTVCIGILFIIIIIYCKILLNREYHGPDFLWPSSREPTD